MRDQSLEEPRLVVNSEYHKIKHQWMKVIADPKLFSFDSYGLLSSILDCIVPYMSILDEVGYFLCY